MLTFIVELLFPVFVCLLMYIVGSCNIFRVVVVVALYCSVYGLRICEV